MADPEKVLWEGPHFKEIPQFLKSNRISLAYSLTSNKGQTCVDKSCFVFVFVIFLLHRIHADFVPFSGALGA